jgi:acyl-[acyl-carrier-protein]-phospholipid O-acyltransferase/long-chain-fatty-acid--[acyl-carrier-protein] ligase
MPKIAKAFKKKFNVEPTEGYGMTELGPIVALNPQDDIAACKGHKDNSVGSVLPGTCVKIASFDDLNVGEPNQVGKIFIKSPSLMLGYLGRPKKTFTAIRDCWYDSGDVGRLDKDGYLKITGRLSRFSKIAGEMIPHLGVEEVLTKVLDTHEHIVAVTSLPDEKKGEQLVVLYVDEVVNPAKLRDAADKSNLPNMWKPRADNYFAIKEMPMLATGKLDIMKLKKLAMDSAEQSNRR